MQFGSSLESPKDARAGVPQRCSHPTLAAVGSLVFLCFLSMCLPAPSKNIHSAPSKLLPVSHAYLPQPPPSHHLYCAHGLGLSGALSAIFSFSALLGQNLHCKFWARTDSPLGRQGRVEDCTLLFFYLLAVQACSKLFD